MNVITDTMDDVTGWLIVGGSMLLFFALLVLGFRQPKKETGWGIR